MVVLTPPFDDRPSALDQQIFELLLGVVPEVVGEPWAERDDVFIRNRCQQHRRDVVQAAQQRPRVFQVLHRFEAHRSVPRAGQFQRIRIAHLEADERMRVELVAVADRVLVTIDAEHDVPGVGHDLGSVADAARDVDHPTAWIEPRGGPAIAVDVVGANAVYGRSDLPFARQNHGLDVGAVSSGECRIASIPTMIPAEIVV